MSGLNYFNGWLWSKEIMFAVNVLTSFSKSFSTRIKATVFSLKYVRRNSHQTKPITLFDEKVHVKNDVTLFHFEDPKYFLMINFFSATQCVFWTYLGVSFTKDLKKSSFSSKNEGFWTKIIEIEREYSDVLSVIAIIFGWLVLAGTLSYSFRSIRKIILHKGGRDVTIVTYNLPGFNTFKIPLSNMSSFHHRTKAKKYIAIKIKNKYLYYLIDIRGQFLNPTLFDFTAGLKRTL